MRFNSDEDRRREARRAQALGRDALERERARRDRARRGLPSAAAAKKLDRRRRSIVQKDVFLSWRDLGESMGLWRQYRDMTAFDSLQLLVDEASEQADFWIRAWEEENGRKIDEEGVSEIDAQFMWALEQFYAPRNYLHGRPLERVVQLLNDWGETGIQMSIYGEHEELARSFGVGQAVRVLGERYVDGEHGVLFRLYPPFVVAWAEAVYWFTGSTYDGETLRDIGPEQLKAAIRGVLSSVGERIRFNELRDFYLDGDYEKLAEAAALKCSREDFGEDVEDEDA